MRTKVTKDGFVWLIISKEAAYQLFSSDIEVFKLYDDDSEGACDNANDIRSHSGEFGIEVGFIKDLLPKCPVCDNALIPSRYEGSDFECLECDNEYLASQI